MILQASDQLVCIDDLDNFAASMGVVFPAGAADAQYYKKSGTVISQVSPVFGTGGVGQLIYFPQLFSAVGQSYLTPGANDVFTFRLNSLTGSSAIIAQGTLADFQDHSALVNGSRVWNTAEQAPAAQAYSDVFYATTYTFDNIEVPALAIKGQPAYGTQNDLNFYCTAEIEDVGSISCKGTMDIRSMESDVYRLAISAQNSSGSNDKVIDSSSETITLTAVFTKNGLSGQVSGVTYNWHKYGEEGITMQDGTQYSGSRTGQTLVVTEAMVGGHALFVCEATYNGNTYTDSIEINDIQDIYAIATGRVVYTDANCTTAAENSNIVRSANMVVYSPKVVNTSTGADYSPASDWTFSYRIFDAAGTLQQSGTVPSGSGASGGLHIAGSTVKTWGGANVKFTGTASSI